MTTRTPLTSGWTVSAVSPDPSSPAARLPEAIPATVPGFVHTDLLAAGLIADPYLDDNERRLAWIGRDRLAYATTFDWDDPTATTGSTWSARASTRSPR